MARIKKIWSDDWRGIAAWPAEVVIMAASELISLWAPMDDAKRFGLVRQHRRASIIMMVKRIRSAIHLMLEVRMMKNALIAVSIVLWAASASASAQIGQPLPPVDPVGPPALDQEFKVMPKLVSGHVGYQPPRPFTTTIPWQAGYLHATAATGSANPYGRPGKPYPAFAWINKESAIFPNADEQNARDVHTITVSDNLLHLTAMKMPPAMLPDVPAGYATGYVSGAMISYPHAQQYGVFEMRAKFPAGPGLWPAFWLLPQNDKWPPEIDIVEVLGKTPAINYVSSHSKTEKSNTVAVPVADTSNGFHTYTLDWGPKTTCWYFDRVAVRCSVTPADWHQPFYIVVNLALGGPTDGWGGPPGKSTTIPASLDISYIKVWQRQTYSRP